MNFCLVKQLKVKGVVAKWLRQRIANPRSWVRLPPTPLKRPGIFGCFRRCRVFFLPSGTQSGTQALHNGVMGGLADLLREI